MTVAGATALSVETSTNAPTPYSPATVVSARVASALLRTASTGLSSISADVLVGGGVEDDLRPVLGEDLAHPLLVLDVGQHRDREADVALADELALDLEQVRLAVVEQHEPARVHARDLAAQLGADRPARAGDQHAAAGQVAADGLDLHPHRVAARGRPRRAPRAAGASGGRRSAAARRRSASCAPATPRSRQALTTCARSVPGRRRDRDQHLVGLDVLEHLRELVGRAEHLGRGPRACPACAGRRRRSRPGGSRAPGSSAARAAAAGRRRRRRRSAPSARCAARGSRCSGRS